MFSPLLDLYGFLATLSKEDLHMLSVFTSLPKVLELNVVN